MPPTTDLTATADENLDPPFFEHRRTLEHQWNIYQYLGIPIEKL